MTRRTIRLARGWAAAAAATALAGASHVIGGGAIPNPLIALFSLAISGVVCTALAGKVLSLWRLGTAVLLSQGLFHGLFALAGCVPSASGGASSVSMVGGHAGHGGQLVIDSTVTSLGHGGNSMLIAHAIAAVVTTILLRRGEVTGVELLGIIALKVRALYAPLTPVPTLTPRPVRPAFRTRKITGALDFLAKAHPHRGPPVAFAAR